MAETTNIAKMAEILSKEVFSEFLWEQIGPWNRNWPCESQELHDATTHPSDVVFYYDEPYRATRTYIQCDLKSYARGSIKPQSVKGAIEALARSVACADVSEEWRKLYIHDNVTPEICGMLFIYNHDGEYDKSFLEMVKGVKCENLDIPKKSKIVVFGPTDIFWLNNVRYEINQMRGKGELPTRDLCQYYYPHLVQRKMIQKANAATLEMLTSPWIILKYDETNGKPATNFVIFCRSKFGSTLEFLYLIDYLMHYQILVGENKVQIKCLNADANAIAYFNKAMDQYIDECQETQEIRKKLRQVTCSLINQVHLTFSELEIGMSYD